MTPEELQMFQARANYSNQEMANLLGIGLRTYIGWRTGRNPIPKLMDLYMAADRRLFGLPTLESSVDTGRPLTAERRAQRVVGEVETWADSIDEEATDEETVRRMHAVAKRLIARLVQLQQQIDDRWGPDFQEHPHESGVEA